MNDPADWLRRIGTATDAHEQACLSAEFLLSTRPEVSREALRATLDAAAVLHSYEPGLLSRLLQISGVEAITRSAELAALPFVECYGSHTKKWWNVHEATRLGWRKQLANTKPEYFRELSLRAAEFFASDPSIPGRIEWIYHLLSGDPEAGATALEQLDRNLVASDREETQAALTMNLRELEDSRLLDGRARVWSLLTLAWASSQRGETARLLPIAEQILSLAQEGGDSFAVAQVKCLIGDVWVDRGRLGPAQAAFAEYLEISRRLAAQDPDNAVWQRELAVAHNRIGGVLEAKGQLAAAQAAFAEYLTISRRLAAQDPDNAGWQRELAVAHGCIGGVLEAQGQLAAAQAAFAEALAIARRLAAQDPNNAGWQGDLAGAHNSIGRVLEAQGQLAAAQAAFAEYLTISRRLAAQDPDNAGWQRELAVAHNRIGGVLEAQGQLAAAQAAFAEDLAIARRLAAQDPDNAGWQRDLAGAHNSIGRVLEAQGQLAAAQAAFAEDLAIARWLVAQDPDNAGWQRDLAVAHNRIGRVLEAQGKLAAAQAAFAEALAIARWLAAQDPDNAS